MARSLSIRPRVFLEINHGTTPLGQLVIELHTDKAPRACENFLALCKSRSPESTTKAYALTLFHRLIPTFILQGGDILNADGTGRYSIFSPAHTTFPDELSSYRTLTSAGLVCLANGGRGTNSNSSQFYISLGKSEETEASVFGEVIGGEEILKKIDDVKVDKHDRPLTDLVIASCGALNPPVTEKERGRERERSRSSSGVYTVNQGEKVRSVEKRNNDSKRHDRLDPTHRGRMRRRSSSSSDGAPGERPKNELALENRRRSASPSRSASPETGTTLQRRRRMRSRSHERDHGHDRVSRGEEASWKWDRERQRRDEAILLREEMEREGGNDRYLDVDPETSDTHLADRASRQSNENPCSQDQLDGVEDPLIPQRLPRDRRDEHLARSPQNNPSTTHMGDYRVGTHSNNERRDHNNHSEQKSTEVKFKGRGKMNYRERGDAWRDSGGGGSRHRGGHRRS